ncbi:MAG: YitT family protein [Clostridium sp.]|uniref:YitT family protein n=1 Tax=Clostridium sp. TaxID=1506 RepID=UPI002673FD25|nr:YitT family protein [Clostridium sp.]MDD7682337.1 YitT family protein [Clostridium sp.]MDY2579957.1 YitT family protein [Clostridium sp.]
MKKIKEYALTTLGIVLTAIALEYFFFPNDIAAGGVSGIALVINGVTGWNISIMVLILNIILFILAFVVLGKGFGGKSIYATVMLSVVMEIIERVFSPGILTDNMFLASFFGSALLAMGSAIVFHQGASTGGTSILAAIISKFTSLGVGTSLLLNDSIICLLAINVFGIDKGLFGFFSLILIGLLIDKFIDGFNTCKQVFIITSKAEMVVNFINKDINRGCTVLNGKGGYTDSEVKIVYTVLSSNQFITLKSFIKENNPEAFITVNDSKEVLGLGFNNDY